MLGGQVGKGQTPGKRLLRLRVVDANGQPLALGRSFARAALLSLHGPREDMKKAAQQVAAAMLQHHPEGTTVPTLAVTIIRGWDIGIASTTSSQSVVQTPAQWQAELGL